MHHLEIEMLQEILALVETKADEARERYLRSQAAEKAGMNRQAELVKMGMNEAIQMQMKGLKGEIECIIDEQLGFNWRTS